MKSSETLQVNQMPDEVLHSSSTVETDIIAIVFINKQAHDMNEMRMRRFLAEPVVLPPFLAESVVALPPFPPPRPATTPISHQDILKHQKEKGAA